MRLKRAVTAARLAANRRSALKSTGPRTPVGKRRSSLNALRKGSRSKATDLFRKVLMRAPFGEVLETADRMMTREQYLHFENLLELFRSRRDLEHEIRRRTARSQSKTHTIEA